MLEKGRKKLGFPEWATVSDWLNQELSAQYLNLEIITLPEIKNLELASYEGNASEEFWEKFPKRDLPTTVNTRVNTTAFKRKIFAARDKMSRTEYNRAKRTLRNLQKEQNHTRRLRCRPFLLKTQKAREPMASI